MNIFQRYIIAYIAGCLAALSIGMLVSRTGIATTIDAWFLTLTIASQDVGDRMMMLVKMFMAESITEQAISLSYLVGHSILEEFIKFIAFYIVFRLTNPSSIREIVFTGMMVGVGFATVETFAFYSSTVFHLFLGFFIRTIGHGLFGGVITFLFGMGYFSRMRWIDSGAHENLTSWMAYYQERMLQILWTTFGLLVAAILHSGVNTFAALGGQTLSIVIMIAGWGIFITILFHPDAGKPYGAILREVSLLRDIVDAEHDLESLERSGIIHTKIPDVVAEKKVRKTLKNLKQFAKS